MAATWAAQFGANLDERDEREQGKKDLVDFFTRLADRYSELDKQNSELRTRTSETVEVDPNDGAASPSPSSSSSPVAAATTATGTATVPTAEDAAAAAVRQATSRRAPGQLGMAGGYFKAAVSQAAGLGYLIGTTAGVVGSASTSTAPTSGPKAVAKMVVNGDHAHVIRQLRSDLSAAQEVRKKYEADLAALERTLAESRTTIGNDIRQIKELTRKNRILDQNLRDRNIELRKKDQHLTVSPDRFCFFCKCIGSGGIIC